MTNVTTRDRFHTSATHPNPETQFQVFTTPTDHARVIATNVPEEFSIGCKKTSSLKRIFWMIAIKWHYRNCLIKSAYHSWRWGWITCFTIFWSVPIHFPSKMATPRKSTNANSNATLKLKLQNHFSVLV